MTIPFFVEGKLGRVCFGPVSSCWKIVSSSLRVHPDGERAGRRIMPGCCFGFSASDVIPAPLILSYFFRDAWARNHHHAFVALSATVRRHPHFMPLPTGQLPAVNVP